MSKKPIIGIGLVALLSVISAACAPKASEATSVPAETGPIETVPVVEASSEEMIEEDSEAGDQAIEETSSAGAIAFAIIPAESQASFTLGELLRGSPKTVIGVTDQVSGEIEVDFENPTNSQVGVIQINADTLTTDNNFRNGAIQRFILKTSTYEYITFAPTSVAGIPESVNFGEVVTFTITGDLTIRDITNEVKFETTVTVVSETRLEGQASSIVAHADYDLTIPEVQQVAEVDEEVLLEIEFVAEPTGN